MALFSSEQKTKEIGIRKVLGSTERDVAGLLAVEIIELVFLANLIAWSVFYYFMNNWLGHFACRTKINIVTFVVVGIMTLVIALATVSFHTVRSALDKFADCFRTELRVSI